MRNWLFAITAALATLPGAAIAQDDGLAQRLASEIRSALPGAVVTVPDPYGLDISYGGQTLSVGIGSVYTACARSILTCDTAIQQYALRAASHMLESAPLTRDQLRIVVRSDSYLAALRAQGASQEFVSEPLAGELRSACYRDLPQGRRPIQISDLPTLQLDAPASLALCRENSARALAPLASRWNALPDQGIGIIRDTDDVTAYLALKGVRPTAAPKCRTPVEALDKIGNKLGIIGTPTLIFGDGAVTPEYVAPEQLERLLNETPR